MLSQITRDRLLVRQLFGLWTNVWVNKLIFNITANNILYYLVDIPYLI